MNHKITIQSKDLESLRLMLRRLADTIELYDNKNIEFNCHKITFDDGSIEIVDETS